VGLLRRSLGIVPATQIGGQAVSFCRSPRPWSVGVQRTAVPKDWVNDCPRRFDGILAYEHYAISLHGVSEEPFISIDLAHRIFDSREGGWHRDQFFPGAFHLGVQADANAARSKTEAEIVVTTARQRRLPKFDVHLGRCQR